MKDKEIYDKNRKEILMRVGEIVEVMRMPFFLENIRIRLKSGRKMYLFLILELLIGSMILSVCLNLRMTSRRNLALYEKLHAEDKVAFCYDGMVDGIRNVPITVSLYEELKAKYGEDLQLSFSNLFLTTVFYEKDFLNVELYCMDDAFFNNLFLREETDTKRDNTVFAGEHIWNAFSKIAKDPDSVEVSGSFADEMFIRNGMLWIDGKAVYPVKKISEVNEKGTQEIPAVWNEMTYDLDDALIFPLSYSEKMQEEVEAGRVDAYFSQLQAGKKKEKMDYGQLNEIVVDLTQKNEYGISFRVADRYLEMARQYETLNILVTYWLMIGGLAGLLVGTGLLGTLFLFQYRRRKSTAISYFCGSTKLRLYAEELCEISIVLITGTLGGNAAAFFVIKAGILRAIAEIRWDSSVCLFLLAGAALLGMVLFLFAAWYDHGKSYLAQAREG